MRRKLPWKRTTVLATAYVVNRAESGKCTVYSGRTASGTIATKGTIAVDPRVFPMGTKFQIPKIGYGIARDTGGAIKGHHIDIAMESCERAMSWGRRTILVSYMEPSHG